MCNQHGDFSKRKPSNLLPVQGAKRLIHQRLPLEEGSVEGKLSTNASGHPDPSKKHEVQSTCFVGALGRFGRGVRRNEDLVLRAAEPRFSSQRFTR